MVAYFCLKPSSTDFPPWHIACLMVNYWQTANSQSEFYL